MERYDLATNAWEAMAPMALVYTAASHAHNGSLSWQYRHYSLGRLAGPTVATVATAGPTVATAGSANLEGKLYAVGGFTGDYLSSVERYDPAANAWEAVVPMGTARCNFAAAVLDGKLRSCTLTAGTTTTTTRELDHRNTTSVPPVQQPGHRATNGTGSRPGPLGCLLRTPCPSSLRAARRPRP